MKKMIAVLVGPHERHVLFDTEEQANAFIEHYDTIVAELTAKVEFAKEYHAKMQDALELAEISYNDALDAQTSAYDELEAAELKLARARNGEL